MHEFRVTMVDRVGPGGDLLTPTAAHCKRSPPLNYRSKDGFRQDSSTDADLRKFDKKWANYKTFLDCLQS